MSDTDAASCAVRLRLLADPTRLAVLRMLLGEGPRHVWQIQARLAIEQSLLSHHLRALRESGLVSAEPDGRSVVYRLAQGVGSRSDSGGIDLGCCLLTFD